MTDWGMMNVLIGQWVGVDGDMLRWWWCFRSMHTCDKYDIKTANHSFF